MHLHLLSALALLLANASYSAQTSEQPLPVVHLGAGRVGSTVSDREFMTQSFSAMGLHRTNPDVF